MKLEEYKSGEYVKMNDYKAFTPSKINYNWGWDDTNYGVEKIKEGFPVCTRLIREIHGILMQGVRKGMLEKSSIYISDYIERNKNIYYDMLTRVRTHNDMIGWIKFFLEAIIETSKTAKEKFRKVVELTMEMDKIIVNLPVKSDNVKKVIDVLYNEPVINRKKLCDLTEIKEGTVKNIINCLLEKNIIVETTGYSRNQIFTFQKYTELFLK